MRIVSFVLGLALLASTPSFGQATELEVARGIAQAERKAIVATNLELTEEEAVAFWPLYGDYHNERRKNDDRLASLIREYADHYQDMTDQKAMELLNELHKIDKSDLDLARSWIKKFQKVLPDRKVLSYYQIERKLDSVVDYGLSSSIPLVK
jgi:hypothetical protein